MLVHQHEQEPEEAGHLFLCSRLCRKKTDSANTGQGRLSQNVLDNGADMSLPSQAAQVREDTDGDVAWLLGEETAEECGMVTPSQLCDNLSSCWVLRHSLACVNDFWRKTLLTSWLAARQARL